ncbi:MAG: hypothetical protein LBQ83_03970 [Candidatus Margulisbacteria bacterium]|jgi:hypothetical protein|nr:hypothetical protein [Candidatus Margulisiibacteriota bacterium]
MNTKIISVAAPAPRKSLAFLLMSALLLASGCLSPLKDEVGASFVVAPEEPVDDGPSWYSEKYNDYSPEEWQACLETQAQLLKFGITSWNRFQTHSAAQRIVNLRQNLEQHQLDLAKPLTVMLYPEYDANGAFSGKFNSLKGILDKANQQLLFFEVRNDTECKAALRLLRDNLPAGQELVLILGGHGQQNNLTWSIPRSIIELDPTDYTDPEFIQLVQALNIKLVVFESCKAGLGSDSEANQANRFAELIRVGGQVIAPLISVYRETYVYDADEKIIDVIYDAGAAGITYRVGGKYQGG